MRALGLPSTAPSHVSLTASATSSTHSLWHSPVSYLFAGLAAMTGLIAFALLVLACSYCRLSRSGDGDADVEQGKTGERGAHKVNPVFEEKFLVVMAGNGVPTFLATPIKVAAGEGPTEDETEKVNVDGLGKSNAESSRRRDRQTD